MITNLHCLVCKALESQASGVNRTQTGGRQRETTIVYPKKIMSRNIHNSVNDVEGCPNGTTSSGRDCHALQVTPDRHQATAAKKKSKKTLIIATWNVRTMFKKGKLDNIKREMERVNITSWV